MSDQPEELASYLLSEEEIEFYLKGDRRDIDKLLLKSINRLTAIVVPHAVKDDKREEAWAMAIGRLGGLEKIEERAAYVDALLEKQKARTAAFRKISESTALWALLIVLGFIAKALWDSALASVKTRIP